MVNAFVLRVFGGLRHVGITSVLRRWGSAGRWGLRGRAVDWDLGRNCWSWDMAREDLQNRAGKRHSPCWLPRSAQRDEVTIRCGFANDGSRYRNVLNRFARKLVPCGLTRCKLHS